MSYKDYKRLLGLLLLLSLLMGLFIFQVISLGFISTLILWGGAITFVGLVVIAIDVMIG